jgi:hypothetical protein
MRYTYSGKQAALFPAARIQLLMPSVRAKLFSTSDRAVHDTSNGISRTLALSAGSAPQFSLVRKDWVRDHEDSEPRKGDTPGATGFLLTCLLFFVALLSCRPLLAQENAAGPIEPPPEHKVVRVLGVPEPEAPPSLPPALIIKGFSQKEDLYAEARPSFAYRKTIRIQEFGLDGKPSGEFNATYDAVRSSDGKLFEKAVSAPESSLTYIPLEPDDVQQLTRLPGFPVTSSQLAKYDLQFLSTESVDEIDCYIFQVKPKTLDRQHPLFDGIIWVDQKYLEVVKTYGKYVTDLGEAHPMSLPFGIFETYRENVDGKYWFPTYTRSDSVFKTKDRDIPIRITIKWTNFKPFPAQATPSPVTTTTPTSSPSPAPPAPTPKP